MNVELNEYCLYNIFDFLTPAEWIHIAEVCTMWKEAVSRNWKMIGTEVCLESDCLGIIRRTGLPIIFVEQVQKMVHKVAPITESLTIKFDKYKIDGTFFLKLGSWTYKVVNSGNFDGTLKIFAQNATELTKLTLVGNLPQRETMNLLFRQNKITKVCIDDLDITTSCEDHLFNEIEEFKYSLNGRKLRVSFDKLFPKLKSLKLETGIQSSNELQRLLSQTLPYVNNLKSFTLTVGNSARAQQVVFALDVFDSIFDLSQLEWLMIRFKDVNVQSMDLFLNKLLVCLPQLQDIHIGGISLSNSDVSTLMSFPNLESVGVRTAKTFLPTDIREMENVYMCTFDFDHDNFSARIPVVSMLEKMPNLKFVILMENYDLYYYNDFDLGNFNDIIFRVLLLAASQNKYVLMGISNPTNKADCDKVLIVDKKKVRGQNSDTKRQLLFIVFTQLSFIPSPSKRSLDDLLTDVIWFLNDNLKDYHAYLYDVKKH